MKMNKFLVGMIALLAVLLTVMIGLTVMFSCAPNNAGGDTGSTDTDTDKGTPDLITEDRGGITASSDAPAPPATTLPSDDPTTETEKTTSIPITTTRTPALTVTTTGIPAAEPFTTTVTIIPTVTTTTAPKTEDPATAGKKIVYLTFDDGPSLYTEQLLGILAQYEDVYVTFFVTNSHSSYQSLITNEYEAGHSIGVHTLKHDYAICYASEEAYFEDFWAMNEIIKQRTGSYSNILRFPGGSSNTVSRKYTDKIMTLLTQRVIEEGFQYFDWNVSAGDAGGGSTTSDDVFNKVTKGIKTYKTPVVLLHDTKKISVEAVARIIEWGLENNCVFRGLDKDCYPAHHGLNN